MTAVTVANNGIITWLYLYETGYFLIQIAFSLLYYVKLDAVKYSCSNVAKLFEK